jgi:signal transduction histidine kinase
VEACSSAGSLTLMRLRGIGTRYALWLVGLVLALVAIALVAAGAVALHQSRLLQGEIHNAVTAASRADEEEALRGMAGYLGSRLFNALYRLDVKRLNEDISEVRAWLPIDWFLVLDAEGRILTDGTPSNERYGDVFPEALPRDGGVDIELIPAPGATELRFKISSGGVTAGWGVVRVRQGPWQASFRGLAQRTARMWASYRSSLLTLGAGAFVVVLGMGTLTAVLLSRTLARPLAEMSQAAGEIAAGNLDHQLTLDSPDELGDLARALHRMAGDIRTHEGALRAERSDLAAKNTELERFTYTVSHDLKGPLVTIAGFAALADTDIAAGKPDQARQDIGRIVAAADRMGRLLDDLLDLSRIGRVVHAPEEVDVGSLAREAVELVRIQLERKGIAIEIAPDLPVVRADRRRLGEVLQNLVENAAKFTDGGEHPRIEVGTRGGADGQHLFFVRDNGRGIDPRFLERVFDIFMKLDTSAEGTGVGLALVRRIVEAHGGRVWAESEGRGRGTTFFVTLPRP